MRLTKILMAACLALGTLAAVPAARADALQNVLNAGKVRVGILTDAAPWGFKDAQGDIVGYDIDFAKLLAADLGVKMEIVPITGASRIPSLLAGKIDVIVAGLGATPERATQVMFSQPYASVSLGVYGPKAVPVAGNSLDALKGKTVSVAKGSTLDVWLTDNAPDVKVVRFEDTPSAIAAYLAGQTDLIAENSAIIQNVKEQNPGKEIELKFVMRQSPAHLGVRQGEQNLLNWLNTMIFCNKLNGKIQVLQVKWFKEQQTLPTL